MSDQIAATGVETHEIDFDGQTLVALTFPYGVSQGVKKQAVDRMTELLKEWHQNKLPFLVVGLVDGMKISFKKRGGQPTRLSCCNCAIGRGREGRGREGRGREGRAQQGVNDG